MWPFKREFLKRPGGLLSRSSRSGVAVRLSFEWTLRDAETGEIDDQGKGENLFTGLGRSYVAGYLIGDRSVGITYFAVGSGTTTPANGDTALATETGRVAFSSTAESPQYSAECSAFANTSELNGTHSEVGLFGEGASGTAGSGILFSRALASFTKTSTQTLTFVWRFAITSA